MALKFYTVACEICGESMLRITLLADRILRWMLDVWKIFKIPCLLLDNFFPERTEHMEVG
jgi:hypothetical protein